MILFVKTTCVIWVWSIFADLCCWLWCGIQSLWCWVITGNYIIPISGRVSTLVPLAQWTANAGATTILLGGWTPLKNMKVHWDDEIPNIWENKKCSKPPTSITMALVEFHWKELVVGRHSPPSGIPRGSASAFWQLCGGFHKWKVPPNA